MSSKSKKLNVAAGLFEQSIEGAIRKVQLSDIIPSEDQPRLNKDVNIKSLAKSLVEEGLLQPIVVTKQGAKYRIIAGERRFRAAKFAKWTEIECRILNKDDKDTYRLAVIENLQRENLDPFEEALAYKRLKDEFSYTDQELSEIIGKSRNYISEILSIADIPAPWQKKAADAGILSKNMLVQYALAIKADNGSDFLAEFKSGTISTVKSAKNYNKLHKLPAKQETPSPRGKDRVTIKPKVDVKSKLDKEGNVTFQLHLDGINAKKIDIDSIAEKIRDYLQNLLKK